MFIEVLESNRTRDGLGVKDLGLGRSAVPRMDDQERSFARLAMQLCRSRKLRSAIARQHVSGVTSTGSTSRVAASIAGRKGVAYKGNSRAARKKQRTRPAWVPWGSAVVTSLADCGASQASGVGAAFGILGQFGTMEAIPLMRGQSPMYIKQSCHMGACSNPDRHDGFPSSDQYSSKAGKRASTAQFAQSKAHAHWIWPC